MKHMGRFLGELGYMARDFAVLVAIAVALMAGGLLVTAAALWMVGPTGLVVGYAAAIVSLCVFMLWAVWDTTR